MSKKETIANQKRFFTVSVIAIVSLSWFLMADSVTWAQSGSRTRAVPRSARSGSTTRPPARNAGSATTARTTQGTVALEGYCPVCVIDMKKWVRGTAEYQATYDGKTYYFPGAAQKEKFLANPAKYVPAFGGDCAVCFATMGQRMPGNIRNAALHNQRLFLFPNADMKQKFQAESAKFENTDLALGGKCAVCRVELGQDVLGKPEFAAVHQGFRYLFPGEKQRAMFLANPAKYVAGATPARQGSNHR